MKKNLDNVIIKISKDIENEIAYVSKTISQIMKLDKDYISKNILECCYKKHEYEFLQEFLKTKINLNVRNINEILCFINDLKKNLNNLINLTYSKIYIIDIVKVFNRDLFNNFDFKLITDNIDIIFIEVSKKLLHMSFEYLRISIENMIHFSLNFYYIYLKYTLYIINKDCFCEAKEYFKNSDVFTINVKKKLSEYFVLEYNYIITYLCENFDSNKFRITDKPNYFIIEIFDVTFKNLIINSILPG